MSVKGYATINSPFARKARIAAIETGQPGLIDWQMMSREERAEQIPAINPLGKVPVVVLESGAALYDSPVICAWIDSTNSGPKLIPESGAEKWAALQLEALGDGMGEVIVPLSQEMNKAEEARSAAVLTRLTGKLTSALAALDRQAVDFRDPPGIGEIAVVAAMGYVEFTKVNPDWRSAYPALAAWYDEINKRPAFAETAPVS